MDPKRQLFLLKSDAPESQAQFARLQEITREYQPGVISPEQLSSGRILDGNVLLIPPAVWPQGAISDLTRFADLSLVALVGANEEQDRVGLWYMLGAALVLDETASPAVLNGALSRLLEVEIQTIRPQLTRKENMLFEVLRRAGKAGLDRAALAERIWENVSVQEKTIDVHIFNLRRKLNSTRYRVICEARRFVLTELAGSEAESDTGVGV